jgi:hypothetical protein
MGLCLQIIHDPSGTWSVHGLPGQPVAALATLTASIDYARKECGEVPATIELMVDGVYAVIHQEHGWPRRLITPEEDEAAVSKGTGVTGPPTHTGFRRWLKRWGKAS